MSGNNLVNNNVSPTQLETVSVMRIDSAPPQTKFVYPYGTGIYFCDDASDYGTQTFAILTDLIGEKVCQAGTFTSGLDVFQIVTKTASTEAFTVYDTTGKRLFHITGAGSTFVDHLETEGTAPTATPNANMGVGATIVVAPGSTDTSLQLNCTAGTSPAAGVWFHVTFAKPFSRIPSVLVAPQSFPTFMGNPTASYVVNVTANGFDFNLLNPTAAAANQLLAFVVVG